MWKILENKLKLKNKSKRFIKDFCNTDKKALEFANKNAKLFQEDFTDKIFNRFNKLSIQKKIDFLNYVLDNKDKDLYVIVVSSEGVYIYQPADYSFNNNSKIMAKDKTDTGFNIYIDNKKFLNTQINCTNGLGISAWCMRVFLR